MSDRFKLTICQFSWLKPFVSVLAIVLCLFILSCCSDYNPFIDETNAKAVVISEIKNGDKFPIFHTKSFKVILLVRDMIEKCSLHVDKNRFFQDTCIITRDIDSIDTLKFNVSFFDTGYHTISLLYVRMSGETVEQKINVYTTNPLSQPEVVANTGDSVHLIATGVSDRDVIYYWIFPGENDVMSFNGPDKWQRIRGASAFDCFFKVSDRRLVNHSPLVRFSCTLNDTVDPKITCLNDLSNDTILVSDMNFYFIIRVEDDGGVISALNNDMPPDTAFIYDFKKDFVWVINIADTLKRPLQMDVVAKDWNSNTSSKRYWIRFGPGSRSKDSVRIKILQPSLATVKKPAFYLMGEVVNNYNTELDSLYLFVNGILHDRCDLSNVYIQKWSFDVTVDSSTNKLKLFLKNKLGEIITTDSLTICYDRSIVDTVSPKIVELSVNGQTVANWNELVIIDKVPVKLRIIAFDEGEGIRSVSVNNNSINKAQAQNYIWETDITSLMNGKLIEITIADSVNQITRQFLKAIINHRPELVYQPDNIVISAAHKFSDSIEVSDSDGDVVIFRLINNNPKSFHIDSLSGKINWIPDEEDSVLSKILISYNDKHYNDMICTLNVKVVDPENISRRITGIISDKEFPYKLIADSQTLDIQLMTVPLINNKQLRYDVHKIPASTQFKVTEGKLSWVPGISDTGIHNITISVYDTISKSYYSQLFSLNVLARQRPIKINMHYSGNSIDENTYDLSDPSLTDILTITVLDSGNVIQDNHIISITLAGKTEVRTLDGKKTTFLLDAMKHKTGYDTIIVSINDQYREYKEKRIIYYGTPPEKPQIIQPLNGQKIDVGRCVFKWTGGDIDLINKVTYSLYLSSGGEEFYIAESISNDTGCIAELKKKGNYYCKIVAFDGKTSVESEIIIIDVQPDSLVKFYNTLFDFPEIIEANDQWAIQLRPEPGKGKPPFTYQLFSSGNSSLRIIADSSNRDFSILEWSPSIIDTGTYNFKITITDSFGNIDMLEPSIRVIPPNNPASFISNYDGNIFINGIDGYAEANFAIIDIDDTTFEQYSVTYKLNNIEKTLYLGKTKTFTLKIKALGFNRTDSLVIKLFERGKAGAVLTFSVIYNV